MKVAILTSSRADYSIYYPLLRQLNTDSFFQLNIIAFGSHLSKNFGSTIDQILLDKFEVKAKIETLPSDNSPSDISKSIGETIIKFSEFWKKNSFDLVFCLGDRYEMFAACAASIPFNIKLAHIHGGEKTLGAIDDCFRHSITHMASIHFTASLAFHQRVIDLKQSSHQVYNVGALSFDNIKNIEFLSLDEFYEKFKINLKKKSILITFHPETVSFEKNLRHVETLIDVLKILEGYQYIITMPNSDTMGSLVRKKLNLFIETTPNSFGIESFGNRAYLTCMKHCSFLLGNTSSGFIEASYFSKPVINLGDRQKGRIVTSNIINCEIKKERIIEAINKIHLLNQSDKTIIYGDGNTAEKIISIIKSI